MEGSVKAKKIDQAMKNYKRAHFLYNFILYSLTSLITCFFFSYQFLSNLLFCLPNINTDFFSLDAKCLFIVANIIIIFILIQESKVARSSNSSPASDIYDEYISRSRNTTCNKVNSNVVAKEKEERDFEEKKHGNIKNVYDEKKKKEMRVCNSMNHKQKKKELRVCKSDVWDESEIMQREKIKGGKEGQVYIPKEELNKRVEAFIARVNKQRLLEAKLVDHSRG